MGRSMTQTGPSGNAPTFIADFRSRDHLVPAPAKLDAAQFPAYGSVKVTVGAGGAAAGAVAVPVTALPGAVPAGTILDFGNGKIARLSANAAAAAVSLTTYALGVALVAGDVAYYNAAGSRKLVPAGTVIGRTITERDAAAAYGPAASTDPEAEIFLTAFDVDDVADINDVELVRPGTAIYENRLPNIATMDATVLGFLRVRYNMIRAAV